MVKYGKEFRKEQKPEWSSKYINYKKLKQQINQYTSSQSQPDPSSPHKPKSKSETIKHFISLLNDEIKHVYIFFNREEKSLHRDINSRLYSKDDYPSLEKDEFISEFHTLHEISLKAVDLAKYAFLNFKALLKITKKFDKKFLPGDPRHHIKLKYIQHKLEEQNSDLLDMYKFKVIDEVCAIIEDLAKALKNVYTDMKDKLNDEKDGVVLEESVDAKKVDNVFSCAVMVKKIMNNIKSVDQYNMKIKTLFKPWDDFLKISSTLSSKLYTITKELGGIVKEDKNDNVNTGAHEDTDNLDLNVEGFNQLDTSSISNNLPLIFKKEHSIMSNLIISHENKTNVTIIMLHTFLYFVSYAIHIPVNISYLKAINKEDKMYLTGLLSAMAPLGAIVSFSFSTVWSLYSTKKPILFAMLCLSVGNLLCFLCKHYNELKLLLIGRFIIGLGCNRVGNKMYLLNFVPKQYFNKYNVNFHIYTLLGLSVGFLANIPIALGLKNGNKNLGKENMGALICSVLNIMIFLFSTFCFSEAFAKSFYTTTAFLEGEKIRIVRNANEPDSHKNKPDMTLDESIRRDTIMIEDINEQLYQVNEENKFTETNLVSKSVNTLTRNEKKHLTFLKGNFIVFVLIAFTSKIINEFIFINSPYFIYREFSITYSHCLSLILGISFICVLIIELIIYLTKKCISDRTSLLILLFLICILSIVFTLSVSYKTDIIFYIVTMCMLILSNFLEKMASSFFGKIIPNDYKVCCIQGNALINIATNIGRIIGAVIPLLNGYYSLINITRFTFAYFIFLSFLSFLFTVLFFSDLRVKAISRILLSKEKHYSLQIPTEI